MGRRDVALILPYSDNSVLMQLRDEKSDILFPGHWGFLGGSMDEGELPKESALRELEEEIGFKPGQLHQLDTTTITELDNVVTHSFFCSLTIPVAQVQLVEGMDSGLFTMDEVMTGQLYSKEMKKLFPVIPLTYICRTFSKLLKRINHNS